MEILTHKEAASLLRVCERTLRRWRVEDDTFPMSIGHSTRMLRYRRADIERWASAFNPEQLHA